MRRTQLQIHLRETEKSVSGALMRVCHPESAEEKASLRSRFTAAVAFVLCQGDFLSKKVLSQLSTQQAQFFSDLELAWAAQPSGARSLNFASEWLSAHCSKNLGSQGLSLAHSIQIWIGLATRHIHRATRGEPEPAVVDWGRREIAFREKFERMGPDGAYSVDFSGAEFSILVGGQKQAQADLQVLGVFETTGRTYQAGWTAPALPDACRPYPVMTCASQLFRATPSDAQAQAQRCAWLSKMDYIVEHEVSGRLYYLGLSDLQALGASEEFQLDDVRGEVLAKLRALEQSLGRREPEKVKDAFLSAGRDLDRRTSLFEKDGESYGVLRALADRLAELGKSITTQGLFGSDLSSVKDSECEALTEALQEIRGYWEV